MNTSWRVRPHRRPKGWRVLHPQLDGEVADVSDRSLSRTHPRPRPQLRWHVRAEREFRRTPRRQAGRYLDLRPGEHRHRPSPGGDEPSPARHRGRLRPGACRQLAPGPAADQPAEFVLANPPFNESDWFRKDDDVLWQFGVQPRATPTLPGCGTSSTTPRRTARHGRLHSRQW